MHAVRKYLEQWAEPETALAGAVPRTYERALVVPACREEATLTGGFTGAARAATGRTLAVLVVNGPDDANAHEHAENGRFLEAVLASLPGVEAIGAAPRAWLGTVAGAPLDVLVVDRASPGARLPRKAGVGLARKIGTDLVLALHVLGRVRSPWIFGTDADTTLPDGYFGFPGSAEPDRVAALTLPYWHEPAVDPVVTRATALHELGLRYYVAGLECAGSPYAFGTLGSATVVSAGAYAAVRGYPKRDAAEDFYLLNKLAKVGSVERVRGAPVRIRSRTSDRTPFGTGASVAELVLGGEATFHHPDCFTALRSVLAELERFADHGRVEELLSALAQGRAVALPPFGDARTVAAFRRASAEHRSASARCVFVRTWFDAFRTLKLIHAVRDQSAPDAYWKDALRLAPFVPAGARPREADDDDPALTRPRSAFD